MSALEYVRHRQYSQIRLTGELPWWQALSLHPDDAHLQEALSAYLRRSRWFQGKARTITDISLVETICLRNGEQEFPIYVLKVRYEQGNPEIYQVPVGFATGLEPGVDSAHAVIAHATVGHEEGYLYDAIYAHSFHTAFLAFILGRDRLRGNRGGVVSSDCICGDSSNPEHLASTVCSAEQTNSTVFYGTRFVLKFYRRVEPGGNPEGELLRYLTETICVPSVPSFLGSVTLRKKGIRPYSLALLQNHVKNQGDAWGFCLNHLARFFEGIRLHQGQLSLQLDAVPGLLEVEQTGVPEPFVQLMGSYFFDMMGLLGRRTAELHLALASGNDNRAWCREKYTIQYQRSLHESLCRGVRRSLELLALHRVTLVGKDRERAETILASSQKIIDCYGSITVQPIDAVNIRIHGDFHLGQVLYTGDDFVVIDFEGEPARSLRERRSKQSPLRDVAGMIRSLHYAVLTALGQQPEKDLEPWAEACFILASQRFLNDYLAPIAGCSLVPSDRKAINILLLAFLLDKALYELAYEMNNRPDWIGIPLEGLDLIVRECS